MVKRKIIFLITAFTIISITLNSINIKAHNPSSMDLIYNSDTGVLSVEITHNVGTDLNHYIESVLIRVNESIISNNPYTSQPSPNTFTYEYDITANIGATIQVTATCSISGSITRSLTVESNVVSKSNASQSISGYIGFWLIMGISISAMLPLIQKKIKKKRD